MDIETIDQSRGFEILVIPQRLSSYKNLNINFEKRLFHSFILVTLQIASNLVYGKL